MTDSTVAVARAICDALDRDWSQADYLAAASAAIAAYEAAQWQLIATAPKNGKSILLGCNYDRPGMRVCMGWWESDCQKSNVSEKWIEGAYWNEADQMVPMYVAFKPTHWRPLPRPPKGETA